MDQQFADLPPWRRHFEVFIRVLIFYSIFSYFAEVDFAKDRHSQGFWLWSERLVAVLFTVEYFLRWSWSKHGWRWPFTFYALIDLAAVLPFYLGFFVDAQHLGVIRSLRVLRLLKMARYHSALDKVLASFSKVKDELTVVGVAVIILILFSSTLMYEFEHAAQPDKFSSLSDSVWWCFVTLTTIGYGDLCPVTWPGRLTAIVTMLFGVGLFGIFVSLIGGALAASRRNNDRDAKGDVPAPPDGNGTVGVPEAPQAAGGRTA